MSMDEYHIKQAHSAIDSLASELAAAKNELREQKELTCGKILPVTEYPMGQVMTSVSSYGTPANARTQVEDLYKKCDAMREPNRAAIKNNQAVYDGLRKLIEAIGIPSSYQKRMSGRRSFRTETMTYDWVHAIRNLIPMHDGWPDVQRTYEQKMKDIAKWEEQNKQQEAAVARSTEAEKKASEKTRLLGSLAGKYGLDLLSEDHDILDVVLSKNKYLLLAHSLLLNRLDWNEGPYHARCGLDSFSVESDLDHTIHTTLRPLIDDWSGDGRVFRDSVYGYEALFGIAEKQNADLMADYRKLSEFMELI